MPEPVYRVVVVLCAVVKTVPIGTNLGLVEVLWMLVSGRLLVTRGALIPGLAETGLPEAAVRRAWAAVGHGAWTSERLLRSWAAQVAQEQRWQPACYEGYRPLAVDVTAFWRPRLHDCPTSHYSAEAGKALPAIPLGIIARIGRVGSQRLGLLAGLVRADRRDPSPGAHRQALLREAAAQRAPQEAIIGDREFAIADMQATGIPAFVVRLRKNCTARRATPPPYQGRGRPPIHGALVRPLARRRGARQFPATPADRTSSWEEASVTIRAEQWTDLVLPDAPVHAPTFSVVAVFDPRHHDPLLLATPLPLSPRATRDLYRDRWPVEDRQPQHLDMRRREWSDAWFGVLSLRWRRGAGGIRRGTSTVAPVRRSGTGRLGVLGPVGEDIPEMAGGGERLFDQTTDAFGEIVLAGAAQLLDVGFWQGDGDAAQRFAVVGGAAGARPGPAMIGQRRDLPSCLARRRCSRRWGKYDTIKCLWCGEGRVFTRGRRDCVGGARRRSGAPALVSFRT